MFSSQFFVDNSVLPRRGAAADESPAACRAGRDAGGERRQEGSGPRVLLLHRLRQAGPVRLAGNFPSSCG
jgi:hypothetical protein